MNSLEGKVRCRTGTSGMGLATAKGFCETSQLLAGDFANSVHQPPPATNSSRVSSRRR